MKKILLLVSLFFLGKNVLVAQNAAPTILNLTSSTDFSNNTITLTYDLEDLENDDVEISFFVSSDGGETFSNLSAEASGDIGFPIQVGIGKTVTWVAPNLNTNYQIELMADDMQPVDIQALVDQVDTNRLFNDLANLEGVRDHANGFPHLEDSRNLLEQHFENHGLQMIEDEWEVNGFNAKNIIGKIRGKSDAPMVYILDGHYDTVNDSPGADDNASAIAGVMEAVRILSNYGFEHEVKFIGFDLEEEDLLGSLHYVGENLITENLGGVINLEMIGYYDNAPNTQIFPSVFEAAFPDAFALLQADSFRGNFIVNAGYTPFVALQDSFYNIASTYVPELKIINLVATNFSDLPNQALLRSDHAAFWFLNRPAIMLTDGADFRNPFYHTMNDTKETLNMEFMGNVVKAAIATIAELAEIRNSTTAKVEVTSNTNSLNCDFQIFPNPTNDILKLNFAECGLNDFQVKIFDRRGVLVFEKKYANTQNDFITIDLQEMERGIYFLKMEEGEKVLSQKILVD